MPATIDLNGTWKLFWCDHQRGDRIDRLSLPGLDVSRAFSAAVPGEVHLDLIRAGLVEEPSTGLNALHARWVEENAWRYLRDFDAPAPNHGERAYLVFEGLDLTTVIYLNGKLVGRHNNAFYPCVVDVTEHLLKGTNRLLVDIEAGLFYGAEKPVHAYCGPDNTLNKRHWLRKTQSQFGWDWSTRLGNVGIFGNVALRICSQIRVDSATAIAELSDDLQAGTVKARIFLEGFEKADLAATFSVRIQEAGVELAVPVVIRSGPQTLEVVAQIAAPQLWWPVKHGAQKQYAVELALEIQSVKIFTAVKRVGFRRVHIHQDAHPVKGRYFTVEINGRKIFIKGGNLVPADMIPARIDRTRYAGLTDRALEANFNLLRVWGGGLYESDAFYELCDEKGLLVWQEFIFACARYPATDDAFLADFRREATYQVRRLASHPSLIIWCGNNEMEWGCWEWGYDKGVAFPDYALFHLVIPQILKREDGSRYYQPSSPYSLDVELPNADHTGDQHPWSVGFAETDFRKYRSMECRFPNEGGILGPTALPTVKACLPAGQDYPGSFAWEQHDNSVSYWTRPDGPGRSPDLMLEQWLGLRLSAMSLEEYVYWAGLVQGAGLAEYIRNFRRRMFDSSAAIFWMYNDCWPVVRSWTIVDYYLRRTPAFHPVRRALQPVTVAIVAEAGQIRVFGINEGPELRGELRSGICALEGGFPFDQRQEVILPANQSTVIAAFDEARLKTLGEATHLPFAILSVAGVEIARDTLIQLFFKEMHWPEARVSVERKAGLAIFSSPVFAWRVCLDLDGEKPLADNFFDVLPGIPTTLLWPDELGDPAILRIGNLAPHPI